MIEHEQKNLQQIENLDLPEKQAAKISYTKADASCIKLQKPEKEKKLEVKIGNGYTSKKNLIPVALPRD